MWHICSKTNSKWNCMCGSRCGYPKEGNCLFHRELVEHKKLDYSLLAHIAINMEEICEDGKIEFGKLIAEEFHKISRDELISLKVEA